MLQYCKEHHLKQAGDLIEFCHIDRYETSDVNEYLTELQMRVTGS
jgi:effector-binding domain-containing protein